MKWFLVIGFIICANFAESSIVKEYKFPAKVDPFILEDRETELWASVHLPEHGLSGKMPLLVFLHGNHSTCGIGKNPRKDDNCQYTSDGTCPDGYVVVPNHRGYDYLADNFTSKGYLVVSINANRGINCGSGFGDDLGLNIARGKLILRHLQLLNRWNTKGGSSKHIGVDLRGRIDFSQVGLMGHSRGGEGIRAAYNIYRNSEKWRKAIKGVVNFRAMFEIAPVDGQTSKVLNAFGVPWTVLLPLCDGDVSDLQGIKPFDRMINKNKAKENQPKSAYIVWGANHNFFNSEWQESDSSGCTGHEAIWKQKNGGRKQRVTSFYSLNAFFKSFIGPKANRKYYREFDPLFPINPKISKITRVDRALVASTDKSKMRFLEKFDKETGTNTYGLKNDSEFITINHERGNFSHFFKRSAGLIKWRFADEIVFFQTNFSKKGRDLSRFYTLDFDIARSAVVANLMEPVDFSIQLVQEDGSLSTKEELLKHTEVVGPVGGPQFRHQLMMTARIPLKEFKDVDLSRITGVRFVFDKKSSDKVYLSNIRVSRQFVPVGKALGKIRPRYRRSSSKRKFSQSLRTCKVDSLIAYNDQSYKLRLKSPSKFFPKASLLTLTIGGKKFRKFQRPDNGDLRSIEFFISKTAMRSLSRGHSVKVFYGKSQTDGFQCGRFKK